MFVDASAIVAILADEPDRAELISKIEAAESLLTSPLCVFETALAVARVISCPVTVAQRETNELVTRTRMQILDIDAEIGTIAIEAYARFGKGRHKAALNMGDCFAYACAKHCGVSLLCKGNDFVHTDIELA